MDTEKPKQNKNTNRSPRTSGQGKREGSDTRKPRPSFERPKPEFDQKMVSIRRVTRVVAGGRRMTFAVAIAIGDKKGSVGLGTGKGGDTAIAIAKALRQAKKNMFKIKTTKDMSISHEVSAKYSSSFLTIMPNRGKGLVAGSTVRDMLILSGIKNVTAKLHSGSKNKLNNARAAYKTLYQLKDKSGAVKAVPFVVPEVKEEIVS
ncbi:MAG TPA: 30S ribosomal protein S5 [Candidatus Paceibacterota bacterium]|nr:30S ribosomal protein S5 [Candidatus Paceibacterota bacterium]